MIYFAFFGLIILCFASVGAKSLDSFSRHKLEDLCRRNGAELRFANILKEYERVAAVAAMLQFLCTFIFLVTIVLTVDAHIPGNEGCKILFSGSYYLDWTICAVGLAAVLLFTESFFARSVASLWGTYVVYYTWAFWRFLFFVFYPLHFADRIVHIFFQRLSGQDDDEDVIEDEIRAIVTEGHREGLLEEPAREMIEGVMELGGFTVSEIMTPRTDMLCISKELTWNEMLQEVIASSHSRIPVYGENRDDIIGVIHSKDILKELALTPESRLQPNHPWTSLMKEPLFVPETKPVDTLLQEFQNTRATEESSGTSRQPNRRRSKGHLAIVLDEYGGVSGIITLEDILEEIVGEILDEHDTILQTDEIAETTPNTFEVLGKVRIDELNEQLHLDLPEEEDYDTFAGYIFSTLGHIPEIGETVDYETEGNCFRFTVLEATRRRIEKIRIESVKEL
jgi:CBS domain containing-hemolysin-like protein